ncbi:MAG: hypothetical protein K9M84_09410 [Spirochaetia bacterium]|nr:hypothetical protein [Spirochaetia bacterium]
MDLYYASKHQKKNGRHEVHVLGCPWLPEEEHRTYLGMFTDCHDAMRKAQELYEHVERCIHCCGAQKGS